MTTNTRILLAVTLLLAGSGCAAGASTQAAVASPAVAAPQSVDLQFLDLPPQATQYLFTASKGPAHKLATPPPAMRYPVSPAAARTHLAAHPIAQ